MNVESIPQGQRRLRSFFWAVALCLNALMLAGIAAGLWFSPRVLLQFTEENMLLENLGAVLFLLSFVLGLCVLPWAGLKGWLRAPAALIPFLGLLGFLDDTSFLGFLEGETGPGETATVGMACLPGKRYVFELWGYKIDAVHDFVTLAFKLWRDHAGVAGYVAGTLLLSAVAAAAFLARRSYMPALMAFVRRNPAFDYLRYAVIAVAIAMVADLDIFGKPWGGLLEELLEMNGGLCLCFAAAALLAGGAESPPSPPV